MPLRKHLEHTRTLVHLSRLRRGEDVGPFRGRFVDYERYWPQPLTRWQKAKRWLRRLKRWLRRLL